MKIRKMNWLMVWLMPNVNAITLAPFGIYALNPKTISSHTVNHENIHWKQQIEMLIIFFYIWYILEWMILRLFKYKQYAYENISFEREAYWNECDGDYLISERKFYGWIKYL